MSSIHLTRCSSAGLGYDQQPGGKTNKWNRQWLEERRSRLGQHGESRWRDMKGQGSNRSQGILGSGERRRRRGDSGMDSLRKSVSGDQRCLSQGFYSCTKHHDQEASWVGKDLFSLHFHTAVHHKWKSVLELKQMRKQELMQRPWRDVLYWLAYLGLLSLLSYRTKTTSPEMVPPTRGLSPLITN